MKDYAKNRPLWTTRIQGMAEQINEACAEAIADTVRRERKRAARFLRDFQYAFPDQMSDPTCELIVSKILGKEPRRGSR